MRSLEKQIDEFLDYNRKILLRSNNTLLAYENDLNSLQEFLINSYCISSVLQVTLEHLRDWQVNMMNDNIGANSIRRKISSVNGFYKYLKSRNLVEINFAKKLAIPKRAQRLPQVLESENILQVLNDLSQGSTFRIQRDYILLLLLYTCGLRKEEAVKIHDDALDLENQQIKIIGKGNKERIVPVSKFVFDKIILYLNIRNIEFDRSVYDTLLLTNKGTKLYAKFVYNVVTKYFGGFNHGKVYPHILRHSFASHLIENGAKIEYVRQLLGHSSLAATQVYTHLSIEQIQKEYKINHPRS